MVNRIGGAIEILGLRAVILDVRQYLNDGRRIEQTNLQISKAQDKVVQSSARAAAAVTGSASQQARANAQLLAAQEKLAASQERLTRLGTQRRQALTTGAAVVGAVGLAAVGAASIGGASKYQTTLAKIDVLTNTTTEDTAKLGKVILDMAKSSPQSPDELGAAAYFILGAGIRDVGKAQELLTVSSQASTAGLGTAEDVAKTLTAVIVAYGESNIDAAQASDILIAAIRTGRAEAQDFAGSIGRILPIASAAGVEFDQVAGALAILTNGGLSADEAATGLRAILSDLTKSSPQAAEALASVGLTAGDLRRQIKDDFPAAMLNLIRLFKGNLAAIEPIIPNIRGLVAASSAFISQGGSVESVMNDIAKAGGATEAAAKQMSLTFDNQAKILKNQLNVALIEIGTAVLPEVTQAVTDLTGWIQKNKDTIQSLTTDGLAIAIGVLKDFGQGIGVAIDLLSWIPKNELAITGAVIAIGAAFAWALPGSNILKGLGLILVALGKIKDTKSPKENLEDQKKQLEKLIGDLEKAPPHSGGLKGRFEDLTKFIAGSSGDTFVQGKTKEQEEQLAIAREKLAKVNEELTKVEQERNVTEKDTNIVLPKLKANVDDVKTGASELEKELKKLAQEFESSSEAAGQVDSLAKQIGLFGDVTQKLADAMNLSPIQAGNVQGIDAVARATERANARSFEYAKTLATIAQAYQQSADVANEIVLKIARTALQASQTAASAVLNAPTREVADLGVGLARRQLNTAQITQRNTPAINALNERLRAIDAQLSAANKQRQVAQKQQQAAQKAQQVADKQRQHAAEAAQRAAQQQVEAIRMANLQAQINADRQLDAMQRLIDATTKQRSDLQKAFLKSNDDLQKQINELIGKGDEAGAFALAQRQQAEAKLFRDRDKGLQNTGEELTTRLKQAQEAEKERQRQVQLQEASLESMQKNIDSTDYNTESTDSNTDAIDANIDSLNEQKDAIDAQIEAQQRPIDMAKQQEEAIQNQIAVYQAQTNVLKAQTEAANKSLLTQDQQAKAIANIIKQIEASSQKVVDLTDPMSTLFIEVKDSNTQFDLLQGAIRAVTDEGFRNTLIDRGIDPAARRLEILGLAAENSSAEVKKAGAEMRASIKESGSAVATFASSLKKFFSGLKLGNVSFPSFDVGGFSPKQATLAMIHPNEVILPLSSPARSRELLGSIPPGMMAAISSREASSNVFAPNISVSGETLDTMRALVHREVDRAFGRAASASSRAGGLLAQGIGPGR